MIIWASEMNTRREFIQRTAGLASAAGLDLAAAQDDPTTTKAKTADNADWYDRPMRWFQLAFVEDDPGNYSPDFWLQYFKSIHADAACLSAGGCVAFYPTKIPLHYKSKFLKDTDPFGE